MILRKDGAEMVEVKLQMIMKENKQFTLQIRCCHKYVDYGELSFGIINLV